MKELLIRGMLLSVLIILACTRIYAAGEKAIGLKIGENIPDFKASDQSGKTRTFKDLSGPYITYISYV